MDLLTAVILSAAFIVKVVDFVRKTYPRIDGGAVQGFTVVLGVGLAFATQTQGLDLFVTMAELPPLAVSVPAWLDMVLTGAILGLASGYLSDLRPSKAPAPEVTVTLNEIEPE